MNLWITLDDGTQAFIVMVNEGPLLNDRELRRSISFRKIANDVDGERYLVYEEEMDNVYRQLKKGTETWRFVPVSVPSYPDDSKKTIIKKEIRRRYGLYDEYKIMDNNNQMMIPSDRLDSLVFIAGTLPLC